MYDRFETADTLVVAVAQEDKDLASHGKFLSHFEPDGPRFEIVADLERRDRGPYKRTSTYLIDKHGIVRQVFPQLIHYRAEWSAIVREVEEKLKAES